MEERNSPNGLRCDEQTQVIQYGLEGDAFHAFVVVRRALDRPRLWLAVVNVTKAMNDENSPTRNFTLGNAAQIRGAVATRRSMPLRYARRERTTIVTRGE